MPDKPLILVIEDNDFVRMQIVKFLDMGDYSALEATNAPEGYEILKEHKNDIACMLVDVRMEPEDGFDFLSKISVYDYKIPAILVTGDENPDILSKAASLGVVTVLMKPVNKDRLLMMVNRAIAGSRRS